MTPTLAWLPLSPERAWVIVESRTVDMIRDVTRRAGGTNSIQIGAHPGLEIGLSIQYPGGPVGGSVNFDDWRDALAGDSRWPVREDRIGTRTRARVSGDAG